MSICNDTPGVQRHNTAATFVLLHFPPFRHYAVRARMRLHGFLVSSCSMLMENMGVGDEIHHKWWCCRRSSYSRSREAVWDSSDDSSENRKLSQGIRVESQEEGGGSGERIRKRRRVMMQTQCHNIPSRPVTCNQDQAPETFEWHWTLICLQSSDELKQWLLCVNNLLIISAS